MLKPLHRSIPAEDLTLWGGLWECNSISKDGFSTTPAGNSIVLFCSLVPHWKHAFCWESTQAWDPILVIPEYIGVVARHKAMWEIKDSKELENVVRILLMLSWRHKVLHISNYFISSSWLGTKSHVTQHLLVLIEPLPNPLAAYLPLALTVTWKQQLV